MSWLPFSSAESVFDNVIISTMRALYLCQEQAVLEKKYRVSEKTHADNDIMTQHKAGFCLSRSVYVWNHMSCALKSHVCDIIIGNADVPIPSRLAKWASGRSLESHGNAAPDLLLSSGLKCNLPLFVPALFPQGGEPNCITKRVKSCSAFGSCRLDWLNYSEQAA